MNKRKGLRLLICFSFGIVSIVLLYRISPRINARQNGFIRLFPPHKLDYLRSVHFKKNGYSIAGTTSTRIYLGNTTDSILYLTLDTTLRERKTTVLSIPIKEIFQSSLRFIIDSPKIAVFEGITPAYLEGNLNNSTLFRYGRDSLHFSFAVPLSGKTWILRIYDPILAQSILIKKRIDFPSQHLLEYILEKQGDGIFSTDGMLQYDQEKNRLIYTYYYRNQFTCLDTNLKVIYEARTIDTVSHSVIHIIYDIPEKMSSINGNSVLVNKISCASDDFLFIHSGLMANNEDRSLFDQASVIDLYDEETGHYIYSFYISRFQNEIVKNFTVYKKRLIALYDHYLVIYQLNI